MSCPVCLPLRRSFRLPLDVRLASMLNCHHGDRWQRLHWKIRSLPGISTRSPIGTSISHKKIKSTLAAYIQNSFYHKMETIYMSNFRYLVAQYPILSRNSLIRQARENGGISSSFLTKTHLPTESSKCEVTTQKRHLKL